MAKLLLFIAVISTAFLMYYCNAAAVESELSSTLCLWHEQGYYCNEMYASTIIKKLSK